MPKGGALRARWKSWNLVCPSCVTHHRSSSKSAFLQKWCEFARLLPPRRARLVLTPRENFQIIFQSFPKLAKILQKTFCKFLQSSRRLQEIIEEVAHCQFDFQDPWLCRPCQSLVDELYVCFEKSSDDEVLALLQMPNEHGLVVTHAPVVTHRSD